MDLKWKYLVGAAFASAVVVGSAQLVSGELKSEEDPPPVMDPSHMLVSDETGKPVGWIDSLNRDDVIIIAMPEEYVRSSAGNPTAIGVTIVRDAEGRPVGLITGEGYVAGGILPDGTIDPKVQASLIDDAIGTLRAEVVDG